MRPQFIVGDGNLWSIYRWMFYSSYSVVMFTFFNSDHYYHSEYSWLSSTCVSRRWVSSWLFYIEVFIWPYGSSKRTEFTFGQLQEIVAWGGAVLDLSVFLLDYLGRDPFLWLFWRSFSLDDFLFINNDTMRVQVSSFT